MKVTFTKDELKTIKEQKEKFELENGEKPNILILPCIYWTLNKNGSSNTLIRCWDGMLVIVNTLDKSIRCGIATLTSDDKKNVDASIKYHKNIDVIAFDNED